MASKHVMHRALNPDQDPEVPTVETVCGLELSVKDHGKRFLWHIWYTVTCKRCLRMKK